MSMRYCLYILMLFVSLSGSGCIATGTSTYHNEDDAVIYKALNQASNQLCCKYHLDAFGVGISFPNRELKSLMLAFASYQKLDVRGARLLLLALTTDFINILNEDKDLLILRGNQPFSVSNVEIELFFKENNGRAITSPYLTVAASVRGKITYRSMEYERDMDYLFTHRESFEEAQSNLSKNEHSIVLE